ncbi:MAG: hypothetical protein Q8M16_06740 [Pirellulaceae bacterium]|nr:hypothetical protein [Pirellulaceae bacterium]
MAAILTIRRFQSHYQGTKAAKTMAWFVVKLIISAILIAVVSEIATRMPRLGALLLTLPLISIITFIMTWYKSHNMVAISKLATETLILVPLGLPFFVPLALSSRTGLTFWPSFLLGFFLAAVTIGLWLRFAPDNFP